MFDWCASATPRGDHDLDFGNRFAEITQLTFAPDGRHLACACTVQDGERESSRILVCEVASRKVRLELAGHAAGMVQRLAYSRDGGLLASGATDATVLVWHAGLRAFADPSHPEYAADTREASAVELEEWHQQLAGADAKVAFQAMVKLARRRAQAVKMLETKIMPIAPLSAGGEAIAQWIRDLGSNQFAVRGKATQALQKLGSAAEPVLRGAFGQATDVEAKRRLGDLIDRITYREWTAEELRFTRAVEVLDAIGTAEARAVLAHWSTGDPAAVLTSEARKALAHVR